jgi:hypothetical protein
MSAECIIWQGAVQSRGYGSVTNRKGGTMLAHRAVWEATYGAIPDGMTIDHLCRTKLCVNVAHMEVVTAAENTRRMLALKTECVKGHPLRGQNLRMVNRADGRTYRVCRECERATKRAYRARVAERAA